MWNSYLGVNSGPSACGSFSCSLHPSEWPTGPTWGTQWVSLTFAKMSWSCQTKGEERAAGRDRLTEIRPLKRLRFNERNELRQITEVQQSTGVDTRDEPESPQHSRDGSRRTRQEQGRHSRTGLRQNVTQGKKHPRGGAPAVRSPASIWAASGVARLEPGNPFLQLLLLWLTFRQREVLTDLGGGRTEESSVCPAPSHSAYWRS